MQRELDALGNWAPIVFILVYALATVISLPGTLVTVAAATLYPLGEAFVYVLIGAMLGASISFFIGRFLARDAIKSILDGDQPFIEKTRQFIEKFEHNSFIAIAYMRLTYVPFVVLNYAAPLTGVKFRDYFWGTFVGILPGTFVFVFMGNTLRDAWESGSISVLYTWKSVIALTLFAVSFALPIVVQRLLGVKDP